jgi:hypothetical protein
MEGLSAFTPEMDALHWTAMLALPTTGAVVKPLYQGTYPRRAKAVRDAAYSRPGTRCWRCQGTYAEALKHWGPRGAAWQAGHVVDGHPGSPLAAEHAQCNAKAGGKLGKMRSTHNQVRSPNA